MPGEDELASEFCKRLKSSIFTIAGHVAQTDDEMVVCYHSPAGEVLEVDYLGYADPDLISIIGHDLNNNETIALVHVKAVHLIVKRVKPATEPENKRRPIGFIGDISKGLNIEGESKGE